MRRDSAAQARIDGVLHRLRSIDRNSLVVDEKRAEDALARHFAAMGLDCPPVSWARDLEDGLRRTVFDPLSGAEKVKAWREAESTALLGIGRLMAHALWTVAAEASQRPSFDLRRDELRRAAWSLRETQVLDLLRPDGRHLFSLTPRWRQARSAGFCATLAAAWRPAMRRHIAVWEPLVDACEAGLWIFWVMENGIVALGRPLIRCAQDRLHSESLPAVEWPSGSRWWLWRGVRVPRRVIEEPASITLASISDERNLEVRRVLIERYGHARFLADLGAKPVSVDDFGTLYRIEFGDDEPLMLVKVVNSTPEPDGSRKDYFLRVPLRMQTAREAVAWTFGLSYAAYAPAVQT